MTQLCLPRRCGCALRSSTLTVEGNGTAETPYHLDLAVTQVGERLRIVADAAARTAALPSPIDGNEAFLTTPNQLTRYVDGTWQVVGQPITSFTPTIGGMTIGNGALTAWYRRVGDSVFYNGRFRFGSTSVASGTIGPISLPVSSVLPSNRVVGEAGLFDFSTNNIHTATVDIQTATAMNVYRASGVATYFVTSTAPFTWALNDELWWTVRYWAA